MQRTFAMLKPGVLQRRIVGEVLARFERKGLKIVGMKILTIPPLLAATHYAEHKGKSFYDGLIQYIISGPVVAMVIEGDEAVQLVRKICGPTAVCESLPGTIRGDFCLHTNLNIIHSSDSPESAERELKLFFQPNEIVSWDDGNAAWY
ncbi:nucleoside-diphosphate kinase [Treponema zuelzerae]|uniref:Nucleoside diphosphate kinase n=1 Tax=Teretinema zuelzerae TaxID=156 RepID=A0AAE3JJ47_9SPIR|nr:nucleoside-diphosphate kinase [Teretinema zuelzerae]MBN2810908.1 nucleoside-diphosphate kinase [Spirochaetales bacterium]MCD1654986.1 nucleoside-diphosphate kinase [Teretinema zuelzerae]HPO02042.1 nucleoside-diphosphate kinase [Treponemataceae bacterium]